MTLTLDHAKLWEWLAEERRRCAALICPHCRDGHPHRRLAESSISGPRTRTVYDLHERPNVGGAELVECWAAAIWEYDAQVGTIEFFPPPRVSR